MLGTFTWEIKHSGDGRTFSRPIFVMSENFIKENKVRRQRVHAAPNIEKGEEINYSKLAIKLSKNLTKDMIFSGSRDILKKIGEYCDKGYEFEVDWSFGTLKCKERKVRFEFNQARLAAILPENLRIGVLPQEEAPLMYDTDIESTMSENQNSARKESSGGRQANDSVRMHSAPSAPSRVVPMLNIKPSSASVGTGNMGKLPAILNSRDGDDSGRYSPIQSGEERGDATSQTVSFASTSAQQSTTADAGKDASEYFQVEEGGNVPMADRALSPRLLEIMSEMEASLNAPPVDKVTMRNKAKERVDEQAYLRSLKLLEVEAKDEERIALEADAQAQDFEHLMRSKVDDFHQKTKTINMWLTEQMSANKEVAEAKSAEQKKYQGSFFLPANAGNVLMPSGSLPGGLHKAAIKEGLRKDLKYQIRHNMERKERDKANQTLEEREYLDHIAMEMDLDAIEERAKHLQSQKILLESWERDAHVRNLKKLQVGGTNAVKEYVSVNLPDAQDAATGKLKTGFGSVGYDTRKGKL